VNDGAGIEALADNAALSVAQVHGTATRSASLWSPMRSPAGAALAASSPGHHRRGGSSFSLSVDTGVVAAPADWSLPSPGRAAAAAIRAHTLVGLTPAGAGVLAAPTVRRRVVGRVPYKVLDAPGLPDDFYLNVLDWSAGNVLAVALQSDVYLWNGATAAVERLTSVPAGTSVASVGWSVRGNHLAVGLSTGEVQIWDVAAKRHVRSMGGHTQRATAVAWAGATLATAGRDAAVYIRDVRVPADYHAHLRGHSNEVCGLRWSPDWSMLATGANDNMLLVWSSAYMRSRSSALSPDARGPPPGPLWRFTPHRAAVKALAWSPHSPSLLASGGGSHDRTIRFHNVATGELTGSVDVGAQVTQLAWSPHAPELASTQGFSQNSLVLWRYPSMTKIVTLGGHQSRVLYMTVAPDGESVVTGAADEMLRFWRVFQPSGAGGGGGEEAGGGGDADSAPLPPPPRTPLLPVTGGAPTSPGFRLASTTSLAAFATIR